MADHVAERKAELRRAMRRRRGSLVDRPSRSAEIVARLIDLDDVRRARSIHVYDALGSEVDLRELIDWARERGTDVVIPAASPDAVVDLDAARAADVVIVPGLAFTADGRRLGQGGGFYDRFLAARRPGVAAIGVAFAEQIVDDLPVADHDVAVDTIVTDDA